MNYNNNNIINIDLQLKETVAHGVEEAFTVYIATSFSSLFYVSIHVRLSSSNTLHFLDAENDSLALVKSVCSLCCRKLNSQYTA